MICTSIAVSLNTTWSQRERHDYVDDADGSTTFDVHVTFGLDRVHSHWAYAVKGSYESLNQYVGADDDKPLEDFGRKSQPGVKGSTWERADDDRVHAVPSVAGANRAALVMGLLCALGGLVYGAVALVRPGGVRLWKAEALLSITLAWLCVMLAVTASEWDESFHAVAGLFKPQKVYAVDDDDTITDETVGTGVQASIAAAVFEFLASLAWGYSAYTEYAAGDDDAAAGPTYGSAGDSWAKSQLGSHGEAIV